MKSAKDIHLFTVRADEELRRNLLEMTVWISVRWATEAQRESDAVRREEVFAQGIEAAANLVRRASSYEGLPSLEARIRALKPPEAE